MSSISNPSSIPYSLTAISHQTGLSVTATAANTFYNIGTAISISKDGKISIQASGYTNGGNGYIAINFTRGTVATLMGTTADSLFSFYNGKPDASIINTSNAALFAVGYTGTGFFSNKYILELLVLKGDSLQFQASNATAGDIVYITDLLVMQQ